MKGIVYTTAIILFFVFTNNYTAQELPYYVSPNGLLVWLPLNGTTLDKSGNGNDAESNRLTNAYDRFGKQDRAVFLDGINGYLTLDSNNPDLMLSNNFTISLWVLPNFSFKNQYLFSKGDKSSHEYALVIGSENTLCFEKESITLNSCTPLIKNQWTNITLVIQNHVAKIYINGKQANTHVLPSQILSSPLPYTFGAIFETGTNTPQQSSRFNGKLDDIAIWNRVLSPDEILLFFRGEER